MRQQNQWTLPLVTALWLILALPAVAQQLKQTQFEDGTGSIGLPTGWKIAEGYHGTVSCGSAEGSAATLGMPWVIMRPESALNTLPAAQSQPHAHVGDLTTALRAVLDKKINARLTSLRTRPAPSVFPGVPALYCLYQFTVGGKSYSALGYFTTIDPGYDSPYWNLYSSAVVAPTAIFTKRLPTMMAVWKSWRPNGQKPKAGSESAIVDEIIAHRQESFEELQKKFHDYILN